MSELFSFLFFNFQTRCNNKLKSISFHKNYIYHISAQFNLEYASKTTKTIEDFLVPGKEKNFVVK